MSDADPAAVTRWSRRFVAAGAGWLVAWQAATLAGFGRAVGVALGLHGFVFHVVFAKGYSLVPSYFDRSLAVPAAPGVAFPLAVLGTALLAVGSAVGGGAGVVPPGVATAGAALWFGAALVVVGSLAWSVRDNLSGSETGTAGPNAHRRRVDRIANAFVPVAFAYLLAGAYETLAVRAGLPSLVPTAAGGYVSPAAAAHLLAAGGAGLLVFAVGTRLLPRFMAATPPRPLVGVVLVAGAAGPALLAPSLGGTPGLLPVAAAVESVAVVGFAAAVAGLYRRSERRRVGLYGVLAGCASGALGVALGLWFAFDGRSAALALAHFRLNVLGFLGLTVVGVSYQFYPPAVGSLPGADDRTALASVGLLFGGLLAEAAGLAAAAPAVAAAGRVGALLGAAAYAYLVAAVFRARPVG